MHGGNAGRPSKKADYNRYGILKSPVAARYREHFEADPEPLDLLPEVLELRVRIADFCDRYDEQTEALIAWHASFNPGFDLELGVFKQRRENWAEAYAEWAGKWEAYREQVEAVQNHYRLGWPEPPELTSFPLPPPPPEPQEFAKKPRQVVDILSAGRFITAIGMLAERIEKQKQEGSITLAALDRILEQFGAEVVLAAQETVRDPAARTALLESVERRWGAIPAPEPGK